VCVQINRMTSTKHPYIDWAETGDAILVTVKNIDAVDVEASLTEDSLEYRGSCHDELYACSLKFKDKVKPDDEDTKWGVEARGVVFHIVKEKSERWGRLLADKKLMKPFIKADWEHWVDSDDEEDGSCVVSVLSFVCCAIDAFDSCITADSKWGDMSGMAGMGGGAGGMDFASMMEGMGGDGGGEEEEEEDFDSDDDGKMKCVYVVCTCCENLTLCVLSSSRFGCSPWYVCGTSTCG